MVRSLRSASGSTLKPVLRFLRNVPSRRRIASAVVVAGAVGVVACWRITGAVVVAGAAGGSENPPQNSNSKYNDGTDHVVSKNRYLA
ncbi:hypothetical protein ACFX2I_004551 [Malus domestica]